MPPRPNRVPETSAPENCAFMEANCRPAIQQGIASASPEHPLNFRDQAPITATGLIDKVLALGGRKFDGGLEDLADLAKFVRTQYADRLRLVHRKIASLAPSLSVLRIEVERSSTYNNGCPLLPVS